MTNNPDDFDQPEFGEELPPPKPGMTSNLVEAWRSRPLFKLLVLMTVAGAVIAASISLFSGGQQASQVAQMVKPPSIKEAPGGPVSPYMREQTEMANAERTQEAIQTGGSALPTPIGPSTDVNELGNDKSKDPLVELRAETERLQQQLNQVQQKQAQVQVQAAPPVQQVQQQKQFDDTLAQAMQRQMQQLMDSWAPKGVKAVTVTKPEENKEKEKTAEAGAANPQGSAATPASYTPAAKALVPAGTVSYAQLLTEANSDIPGAILAQIVSGPLAGARAIGSFQVANDYLVLHFSDANLKGKDYSINALALDPNTTLGGMATEVDERYFTRVLLPAAAGFMQGFGSALSVGSSSILENGTTTVVQQSGRGLSQGVYYGLAQGAQTMGQFFQNQANQTQPLIRVAAGTPMGLFFITSVQETGAAAQPVPAAAMGSAMANYPGNPGSAAPYPGYGYPNAQGYPPGTVPNGYYPGAMTGYGAYQGYGNPGYGQAPATSNVPYPNISNPYPGVNSPVMQQFPSNGSVAVLPYYSGIGTTTFGH